jgi:hypothetical protein
MSTQMAGETRASKYDRLIAAAKAVPTVTTIVVHPCDESSLRGRSRCCGGRDHQPDSRRPCVKDCKRCRQTQYQHFGL